MVCSPDEEQNQSTTFNPLSSQYTCCYQRLHANTASKIIAWFHVVVTSGVLAYIFRSLLTGNKTRLEGSFEMLLALICLVASFLLILGLRLERRKLVLIYLYCQAAATALLFVLFLALIMGLKAGILDDPNHDGYNTLEEEMLIMVEIFALLAVVLMELYFVAIVLRSYRFLNDKYDFTGVDREAEL